MSYCKELDYSKAIEILHQNNYSKCGSCAHRTQKVFNPRGMLQCNLCFLTMCNEHGDCIWYQRGKPWSKEVDLELAKKRMGRGRIYYSRKEWVDV